MRPCKDFQTRTTQDCLLMKNEEMELKGRKITGNSIRLESMKKISVSKRVKSL